MSNSGQGFQEKSSLIEYDYPLICTSQFHSINICNFLFNIIDLTQFIPFTYFCPKGNGATLFGNAQPLVLKFVTESYRK